MKETPSEENVLRQNSAGKLGRRTQHAIRVYKHKIHIIHGIDASTKHRAVLETLVNFIAWYPASLLPFLVLPCVVNYTAVRRLIECAQNSDTKYPTCISPCWHCVVAFAFSRPAFLTPGGSRTTEESEVYPLYRYEDEMAARKLVRAGRAYIARRVLYILRRDKMR